MGESAQVLVKFTSRRESLARSRHHVDTSKRNHVMSKSTNNCCFPRSPAELNRTSNQSLRNNCFICIGPASRPRPSSMFWMPTNFAYLRESSAVGSDLPSQKTHDMPHDTVRHTCTRVCMCIVLVHNRHAFLTCIPNSSPAPPPPPTRPKP